LPDPPGHPLHAVVDAAGGDPGDPPLRARLTPTAARARWLAWSIRETPSPDARQAAGHRFRQVAIGFQIHAAAGPARRGWH